MDSLNDPRHVAIHEAGHAVVQYVLGIPLISVTIEPNVEAGEAGHNNCPEFQR